MKATTTIEVKCDCKIPFHLELESHLEKLLISPEADLQFQTTANLRRMNTILQSKLVFIKVTNPIKNIRPRILKKVKHLLNKDLVGIIKGSKNEITLILL